jgi:hypothetical protein
LARANDKLPPDYLQLQPVIFSLSMVMMHDVVNPPAASRYYAYCMLGAYEILAQNDPGIIPLNKIIRKYPEIPVSAKRGEYDYKIAAVYCILETGRLLFPSGYQLKENEDKYLETLAKNKIPSATINASVKVANEMAAQVVAWSRTDNYFSLSTKVRYTPKKGDGFWYPTPPAYMEAVEPNWRIIRTMVIDSAGQFKPLPFAPFSTDSTSGFYKLAREVYDLSIHPTDEQANIAAFWDCNPFAIATSGHMTIGFKKMSPGGHWMNITSIACTKAQCSFEKTLVVHAFVSIALLDAFISCWDEKYRSNRIRPETFINRYIDARWQPVLQTPPFPEYASGHSVISAASAEILTYFLGDNFAFTDNSEIMFELPPRSFQSFRQAAEEAAISRLYGGIHYRDAIDNGVYEGKAIGEFIVAKIAMAGGGKKTLR